MPRFKYVAMDPQGGELDGVLDAESQTQVVSLLRSKGLFPTRIVELGGGSSDAAKKSSTSGPAAAASAKGMQVKMKMPSFFGGKVKPKQLCVFTRQLATLIDAGMPLLRGLRILLKQEKTPALKDALNGMGEAVEGGSTFSESLGQFPKIFDNLFVNMVKAGEAGGVLEVVLTRLAEFMEKAEKIKSKVKSAMTYPIVVLCAALGILSFLLVKVIPKFEQIFKDLIPGGQLPALTKFVINLSGILTQKGLYVVGLIAVLVFVYKAAAKTKAGIRVIDKAKLKIPVFGTLTSMGAISRFTRTLGTLMSSGVPVLQALSIVRDTSGNTVIADAIQKVHDNVKEGETMSSPMEATKVFPGMVISMIDVGEETGALPEMLMRIADTYDDEVDNAVEAMTSIIEPILIIMLAVIVGTIVIAMFVPLISIIGSLS